MDNKQKNEGAIYYFRYGVSGASKYAFHEVKPDVKYTDCGADSFAIAENEFQHVLAVADGVGESNDSEMFARHLMENLEKEVMDMKEEPSITTKSKKFKEENNVKNEAVAEKKETKK